MTNLTQLQNLIFNKGLSSPYQFWISLGKIFKLSLLMESDEASKNRKFCSIMRALALYIFRLWKMERPDQYKGFQQDHITNNEQLSKALANASSEQQKITLVQQI